MEQTFKIEHGLDASKRARAAQLYWEAFGPKLMAALGPEVKGRALLERVLEPDHVLVAVDTERRLLGLAGFKTTAGAFVGGGFAELSAAYGMFGGLWRGLLLWQLDRPAAPHRLVMDGLCVDVRARGLGVGRALLEAVVVEARRRGLGEVRLDVIDTNGRARALYERCGFRATRVTRLGPLRHVFGFAAATTMVRAV